MKVVEDLAEDALPPTTKVRDNHVHGAAKYCQLGVQAWDKVIEGTLSGTDLKDVPALLIADLAPALAICSRPSVPSVLFCPIHVCSIWVSVGIRSS